MRAGSHLVHALGHPKLNEGCCVSQVVVVDHDSDVELVRVDAKAAEAIDLHCDQGPVACIQVGSLPAGMPPVGSDIPA